MSNINFDDTEFCDKIEQVIKFAKGRIPTSVWEMAVISGIHVSADEVRPIVLDESVWPDTDVTVYEYVRFLKSGWDLILNSLGSANTVVFMQTIMHSIVRNEDFGNLRTTEYRQAGLSYVPPMPDAYKINDDIMRLELIDNPALRAVACMCYIIRTAPFRCGNRRVALLICNKILIENGVGILSFRTKDNLDKFIKLMNEYYETDRPKELFSFVISDCIEQI